ncbi:hypothetical protein DY000_02034271 [Brassica cretica]|uniref:Uncharacterized protein n=1 Tax=Brassica cretica TaxID=69181 RepID=A0ABQ7DSB5_BRACR|nr:hypothetical protein DY000_02034271 [Brassica cretica]
MKSGKNGKNYQRPKDQSSKHTNSTIETRIKLGRSPSWTRDGFSSAVRRAEPVQFGERPSWTQDGFSTAVRRAGPELIQLGRSPSWTSPVRRTAKLDQPKPVFASSS